MYNRNDPRFRRTLNQISHNLESANESAQIGLFSFSEHYIKPCLSSVGKSLEPCTAPCFPRPEDRRRHRGRSRGRAEPSFDFYDDWEEDENDALLTLGNDEFERLLGGSSAQDNDTQPGRQAAMSYGSRGDTRIPRPRRRSVVSFDGKADSTIIPNQSRFGFLSKLPFKIGGKGLRYQPSAADLQERPRTKDRTGEGPEDILEEEEDGEWDTWRTHVRKRSATTGSGRTGDSYSSRGDIFPSDDEADAVPLDDEFAVALERRSTQDESSSGKTRRSAHPRGTRNSSRTLSTRSGRKPSLRQRKSSSSTPRSQNSDSPMNEMPTMLDLKLEEERARAEEEHEIERKREAARKLARERGLNSNEVSPGISSPVSKLDDDASLPPIGSTSNIPENAFPFPTIELQATDSSGPAQPLNEPVMINNDPRTSEDLARRSSDGASPGDLELQEHLKPSV